MPSIVANTGQVRINSASSRRSSRLQGGDRSHPYSKPKGRLLGPKHLLNERLKAQEVRLADLSGNYYFVEQSVLLTVRNLRAEPQCSAASREIGEFSNNKWYNRK